MEAAIPNESPVFLNFQAVRKTALPCAIILIIVINIISTKPVKFQRQ